MTGIADILKLIAGAVVGLVLGYLVGHALGARSGFADGQTAERIVRQQREAEAETKARAARDAAQAEIDAVERDFYAREAARKSEITALELALQKEMADDQSMPAGAPCACRSGISRGMRDALAPVGRAPAASGKAAAKPNPAVRRSR